MNDLPDADHGLVRRERPRPAVAPAGHQPVGGDGLGVHAPADPGGPGAAGPRDLDDARGRRRPTWRPPPAARPSAPGAGSATRAARCGCTPRPWRSPSATTARCPTPTTSCARCPASATTPLPRSRPSRSAGRTPSWTPTCAGCWGARSAGVEFPAAVGHPCRARPGRRTGAGAGPGGLGGRGDGARRPGLHRGRTRLRDVPGSATGAPGTLAGRPAVRRPRAQGQTYAGTDRMCRGRLLAVLRDAEGSVSA